ncbi:zinc finger protein 638 [Sander lucioperca]|uniref:zinc finger protein 638 n=1 Tax=Sander lucioperca TaxID=283035 RepID=UPI0016536145|nr:zinc finger protein 638 [Sander lucioperca]
MSHPLYNPYAPGNQSSTQGQYGLSSIPAERDPQMASSRLGPGSSFNSPVTSSGTPANSGGILPSLLPQSMNYRPEQSRAIIDENIERSIDMHISRAREEVRLLGKPMHQPIDQGTCFTSTQRNEFLSSGTGMVSYQMSSTSASLGHRQSGVESCSNSLDWSSNLNRPTADTPSKLYPSSASSNYASGGDGRFSASSESSHKQSIPDKPAATTEPNRPKYTSESASNILQHFGLEKEDLEHLISYPEDQITPANLPLILRQIRIEKTKRASTAVQLKPCPNPQPTRSVSEMNSHSLSSSGGAGMRQEEMSSAGLQQSKVIDYGHTGSSKANSGETGNMLQIDTCDSSRHIREPLQKNTTEVKSSALGSLSDQASSVSSLSSWYSSIMSSVASPSNDQTRQLQTQPKQTSQTVLSSFSLPKKDTNIRVLKSEAPKPLPLKEPEAGQQSMKTQPPPTLYPGVHPSQHGLVLFDSNDASGAKDQSKTQGQRSTVAEQMKKQQTQKQPIQQTEQAMWPPVFSAVTSVPPASQIPSITNAMQRPLFIPGGPHPNAIPPALPQPIPGLMNRTHLTLPPSNSQPPAKRAVSKGLPTAAMMHDYAMATPRIFPHTCTLCNKECTRMKDWISHQNTSLHLESYKLLRKQYPEWDGAIETRPSAAGKDAKLSPETCIVTHQHRHQKVRQRSRFRSHSSSPRRRHGSEGRREKSSSRSSSPQSPRYTRRSRSRSRSPWYERPTSSRYRSRSRSRERQSSLRRRDEKRSSPRRRDDRRSSPRRNRERRSSPRSGRERRSSPRRSRERRSSPRSSRERRSSPRSSLERRSSSRSSRERRSSPRSSCKRRSSPRRSHERRWPPASSDQRQSPQRKDSFSAESLAEKLLESTALQSLSNQSDLEAVVKTLAPALLAELAKMKPSSSSTASSSSISSTAKKKELPKKLSKINLSLQKGESGKSSTTTMVQPQQVFSSVQLLKHKSKSIVLSDSKLESQENKPTSSCEKTKTILLNNISLSESNQLREVLKKNKSVKNVSSPQVPHLNRVFIEFESTRDADQLGVWLSHLKQPPGYEVHRLAVPYTSCTSLPLPQPIPGLMNRTHLTPPPSNSQPPANRAVSKGLPTAAMMHDYATATPRIFPHTCTLCKKECTRMKDWISHQKTSLHLESCKLLRKQTKVQRVGSSKSPKTVLKQPLQDSSEITLNFEPDTLDLSQPALQTSEPAGSTIFEPTTAGPSATAKSDVAMKDGPVTAVDAASASDASKCNAHTRPTKWGRVKTCLRPFRIKCLKLKSCLFGTPEYNLRGRKQLLITNLPEYYNGCYTEKDLADFLIPFGFQYTDDNLHIVPLSGMAFVVMPKAQDVYTLLKASQLYNITFKGSKLCFRVMVNNITMTPLWFYKSLMKLMRHQVCDDGSKTIFIKNISWRQSNQLREDLEKINSVKHFLPLLNKVFVEFISIGDADRLGVWHSLLKRAPCYEIHRLKIPCNSDVLYSPKLCGNILPDSKHAVAGATVRPIKLGIPQRSVGPVWVTMRTSPFLFPTISPWFIIPDYLTVRREEDIEEASTRGSMIPTIMLTGLPEKNYKYEDVAELVWWHFPKWNLHSLYYNITVLTLQRRAFLFFPSWTTCCTFVREHIACPFSINGCTLGVHFVLEHMYPESSEEMMYTTLMKWSNAGVPEPTSLEERLMCVEVSEASVDVVRTVIEEVASIATFVGFLPLANRICIEMADSSGVTKVVEKYNNCSPDSLNRAAWTKVQRVESLESLKQRLQDSSEITLNFEPDTINVKAEPPAVKCQTQHPSSELLDNGSQPALQTSDPAGSTISEPTTAGPSATAASDVAMEEDCEKPGTEIAMDSTVDPEANEDVEKAEVKGEEGSITTSISTADVTSTSAVSSVNTVPAASSPDASSPATTVLMSEENFAKLPQISTDIFQAVVAAVHSPKLTPDKSQSEEKDVWLWSDSSLFSYQNWCPGQPNNHHGSQHCLQMNFGGGKCWDDVRCSVRRPFVCSKKIW